MASMAPPGAAGTTRRTVRPCCADATRDSGRAASPPSPATALRRVSMALPLMVFFGIITRDAGAVVKDGTKIATACPVPGFANEPQCGWATHAQIRAVYPPLLWPHASASTIVAATQLEMRA